MRRLILAHSPLGPSDVRDKVVAVPGQLTSAHLALRLFEPNVEVRFVRFDEVMSYVREGFGDAGVIIHEGQLTYPDAGLHHREEALEYASSYAGDMPDQQVDEFVGMYVNQRTLDLGEDGRQSVKEFLERGYRAGLIDEPARVDFFEY